MNDQTLGGTAGGGERPLVTFALFAYNQEKYILEATASALAQSYSPLEIILSDDCSTDQTLTIMEEVVAGYAGPHRVILNRNPANLGARGIGAHVNHILGMARGELVVFAAGDDISLPHRASTLVNLWTSAGRPSGSLHSAVMTISNDSSNSNRVVSGLASFDNVSVAECVRLGCKGVLGATHAITKDLFEAFGPLPPNTLFEDRTLAFRSLLAGKLLYSPEALVKYRQHSESITSHEMYEDRYRWERWINGTIAKYQSFSADYMHFNSGKTLDKAVLSEIGRGISRAERARDLVSRNPVARALAAFHYSNEYSTSDRLAFILQRAGLKNTIFYQALSALWRKLNHSKRLPARP